MSEELKRALAERDALDQSYLEQIKVNIVTKVALIEARAEVEKLRSELFEALAKANEQAQVVLDAPSV